VPNVKVPPVKATFPKLVFVTVRVFAELVLPTGALPNARGLGLTLAVGAGALETYSTAPMSTVPSVFRFVPKMSKPGAIAKFMAEAGFVREIAPMAGVEPAVSP
jgi:hypothetical protein